MTAPTTITLPAEPRLVGPLLRTLRVRLGFSQRQLVDAGVGSHATISDLENARKMPLLSTVLAYLAAIGCGYEVRRIDGSPIPEATVATRARVQSRAVRDTPAPEPERCGVVRTATGRCLTCFGIHDVDPD